mmetsp:Transcript_5735/g.10990  ORF Transcript_5735/g.10990 Transcript_5735/m.10990 type:complete len:112 (+) Transcript_5735:150-485(+)
MTTMLCCFLSFIISLIFSRACSYKTEPWHLQLPLDEIRVVHLEKCLEVEEASGRCRSFERSERGVKELAEHPLSLQCPESVGSEDDDDDEEEGQCHWGLKPVLTPRSHDLG